MPQFRWGLLGVLLLIGTVAQSCKKPTVEEDKGVLPLPQAPTREAVAAESTAPTAEPEQKAETPISLEVACAVVDEHMKSYGISMANRECGRLLMQEQMLRIDGYSFEWTGDSSKKAREDLNACLWKSGTSDSWQVGYLDRMNRPCQPPAEFCKMGANRVIYNWSHAACPADTVHKPGPMTEMIKPMVGTWALIGAEEETLDLTANGLMVRTRVDEKPSRGTFRVMSATAWELEVDDTRQSIAAVVIDGDLYWSRGVIVPDGPAGSFMMPLPGEKRIRRYKNSCYLVSARPSDYPMHVPCTVRVAADGKKTWEIKLSDSRLLTLHKVGPYWMDSESLASRYKRVQNPKK